MAAVRSTLLMLALAAAAPQASSQHFQYVEPGLASCPAVPVPPLVPPPAPDTAAAKRVPLGAPQSGSLKVACGFEQGSYTVSLNSTDPGATFVPRTFLVNFGRIAGNGVFSVRFSTAGVQRVTTSITSNMGSPAVRGQFVSPTQDFNVVAP